MGTRKFPSLRRPSALTTRSPAVWHLRNFWFVLFAPEFWASCSVYRIDSIAFNLSCKAVSQYLTRTKGGKWHQIAPLVPTLQLRHLQDNKDYYT